MKDAAKSNTAAAKASETETTAGTSTSKKEDPVASYDDVKKAITGVASAKGRETAVAMLARFGATSGTTLKAEQYAEVLEMANKILTAGYDPIASNQAEDELA